MLVISVFRLTRKIPTFCQYVILFRLLATNSRPVPFLGDCNSSTVRTSVRAWHALPCRERVAHLHDWPCHVVKINSADSLLGLGNRIRSHICLVCQEYIRTTQRRSCVAHRGQLILRPAQVRQLNFISGSVLRYSRLARRTSKGYKRKMKNMIQENIIVPIDTDHRTWLIVQCVGVGHGLGD